MRVKDTNKKSVRIHDENVNKWVESMPYGYFTILVNDLLVKEFKKQDKVNSKLVWERIPKELSEFNDDSLV